MTGIPAIILGSYCLLLIAFIIGWMFARRRVRPARQSQSGISVVIACRNEEQNLEGLFNSLSGISYPVGKWEVILVDDHSTDKTLAVAKQFAGRLASCTILSLPENTSGKKSAMSLGIAHARFEVIVSTDADCSFQRDWLSNVALHFQENSIHMLIGAVRISGRGFFSKVQSAEFTSVVGVTGASCGLGHPVMSNGANLAFRKSSFLEVKGYEGNEGIPSGDDEFLMRKILQRYPRGIVWLNEQQGVVNSVTQPSFGDFFNQRIRWAGKWAHNSDIISKLLAVFILASQVAFGYMLVRISGSMNVDTLIVVAKIIFEAAFLFMVSRFLRQQFSLPIFILLQFTYPIYVVLVGTLSLMSGYRWKARKYP